MTEAAPEVTAEEAAQPAESEAPEDSTDWKSEARKWEQRAKENRNAAQELEKQRKASMTESERAVAEAEARGRTAAATEASRDLARAKFDAIAARRNPALDDKGLDELLEFVDMGKFLTEDGRPDVDAIRKAAEKLIPAGSTEPAPPPSMDLGQRRTAPAKQDMNTFLRQAAGRA